jgi:predicted nucleic-acid-binding protein
MPAVDTNVLVRLLVQDDEVQSEKAANLIDSLADGEAPFLVTATVLLELEWVLRSRYRFGKARFIAAVVALLETRGLEVQEHAAVEHALHMLRQSAAEFADCLHAGLAAAAHRDPLLTFDVGASRLAVAQLI